MASSVPWNIPFVDNTTVIDPISAPLNAMATALNTALTEAVESIKSGYFIGTNAQRLALIAPDLRNGITWYATDTNVVWRRASGAWVADTPFKMAAGVTTSAAVSSNFVTVNLPAGFTQPPLITLQVESPAGPVIGATTRTYDRTTTSFKLACTAPSVDVVWHAVQMTPTTAAG